ncbi:hypothetical protein C7B65_18125 [Phormidesmis priestleyi ULC007]|uniref:Uncharacterized protein n=1 Tax=Phormidesmis priestleyi ULC007 TaxID=1920490 RepID=A0A2T1DAX4_9CYAN|nr:hypothetical protein [Phormidesmis priestleyi]PSB17604.1 hypothetical protein C7B65_18125 [Phormidesmis priestleyi ULC007]PZO48481.1 MAG: hypothetical protein DCF14_16825 [Phormidesmis priestleyi]
MRIFIFAAKKFGQSELRSRKTRMCIHHPDNHNDQQQQTLECIFKDPPLTDILWTNAIALLAGLQGATIREMSNKICVRVPHPDCDHRITILSPLGHDECVDEYQVMKIREFLTMLDIRTSRGN